MIRSIADASSSIDAFSEYSIAVGDVSHLGDICLRMDRHDVVSRIRRSLSWRMCSTVGGECVPDISVITVTGHDAGKPIAEMPTPEGKDISVYNGINIGGYFPFHYQASDPLQIRHKI
jgi:hypothetical protein